MQFDLIGVDCSLANAFRRILLSEVATMAIEKVFVFNNTSLFQDEFLAHRLGLIPIKADPRLFKYREQGMISIINTILSLSSYWDIPYDMSIVTSVEYQLCPSFVLLTNYIDSGDTKGTPEDTIVFNLKLKCLKNKDISPDSSQSQDNYEHRCVYTKDLVWEPIGNQSEMFRSDPIRPVDDDILIAKLAAGQELDLQMHCVKGIGRDHAKFSPVATASYRLLPRIELLSDIEGDDADLLQKCFSKGVIEVNHNQGKRVAIVVNPRLDSASRNVLRFSQFKDRVNISLVTNHFICKSKFILFGLSFG